MQESSGVTASVKKDTLAIQLSLMVVMTALVTVTTFLVRIPNPMGGYFNFGDVMIFVVALTFRPAIGGFAGGVGSAISDSIGFPLFVIPTLVIKGVEGLLAGLITNKKSIYRDVLAVCLAGGEMILGYFLVEWLVLPVWGASDWGLIGALGELPGNIGQILIGAVVGIPVAYVVRRRLPEVLK
jgi:uncharacterized membrane protein